MNNLTNQTFGRLRVISRDKKNKHGVYTWLCVCECGNKIVVPCTSLKNGDTKSCGCLKRETVSNRMSTHGLSKTRLYRVWAGIKNRCYNEKASNYKYYGAKGITMCSEWKNSFEKFHDWAFENGYDETANAQSCTIDRIDITKGYYPDNCRWVDHTVQCNNQTSNKLFSFNSKTMTMAEWARETGINYSTLRERIRKGVPFEEAVKPVVYR